jgi:hypothetical protein
MLTTKHPPLSERRLMAAFGLLILALSSFAVTLHVGSAQAQEVTVHKSPSCGCCGKWAEHLRQHGFAVALRSTEDLDPVKLKYGVPANLASCHTALVGGYVIEGHVPAADIRRLLDQRPAVSGLTVPGMPAGSPGMEASASLTKCWFSTRAA